jgi:Tfp pilus assembly protein PilF
VRNAHPPLRKVSAAIMGIVFGIVALELILRLVGVSFIVSQEFSNRAFLKNQEGSRILCLGDSMTARQYPRFLEAALNNGTRNIRFQVIDKGKVMSNSTFLVSILKNVLDKYKPDMVVVMTGVNDYGPILPYADLSLKKPMPFKIGKLALTLWYSFTERIRRDAAGSFDKAQNDVIERAEKILADSAEGQEKIYKQMVEHHPKDATGYAFLGLIYRRDNKFPLAAQMFQQALALAPGGIVKEMAYANLGIMYMEHERPKEAEAMFKKTLEVNPRGFWSTFAYNRLGTLYTQQRRLSEAKAVLERGIQAHPFNDRLYGALAHYYKAIDTDELAYRYYNKADSVRANYYNPTTAANYRKIARELSLRNIRLVCVQYPMRSIEPLKKMLTQYGGVIFVDNEKVFKDAVGSSDYKDYFIDRFAGDFGHCTPAGNTLLAATITKAIIDECADNRSLKEGYLK